MQKIKSGTDQLIILEHKQTVTLILKDERSRNALSEKLTPFIRKFLFKLKKNNKYKILIIRGYGNSFCSGGNIKRMETNKKQISSKAKVAILDKKQRELTGILYSLSIPTIAVITGPAAGAGFALALACDIRVGTKEAFFISNYSRIGLSGDYGISWFLTRLVGESKAKEIMFLNNRILAPEAKKLGLINKLVEKELELELNSIIDNLSSQSSLALSCIKKNINNAHSYSLNKAFNQEAKYLIKTSQSKEHKEAVLEFKKTNT